MRCSARTACSRPSSWGCWPRSTIPTAGHGSTPGGPRTDDVAAPAAPAAPVRPAGAAGRTPARLHAAGAGGTLGADLAHVGSGGLETLLDGLGATGDAPSGSDTVERSLPRWFRAREPAVVVQGCKRSLKHGGDG